MVNVWNYQTLSGFMYIKFINNSNKIANNLLKKLLKYKYVIHEALAIVLFTLDRFCHNTFLLNVLI